MLKRVAVMNDLSGLGHCSLSASMAVFPAMGIQCCPVPTCVLSTQTDGYDDFSFFDLTHQLKSYINHWKSLGENFDAIFTGYFGSTAQFEIADELLSTMKAKDGLALVDPVMGDDGSLYSSMSNDICSKMRKLISRADIITPNLTEACLLAEEKYKIFDRDQLVDLCIKLTGFGPKCVVISGTVIDNKIVMACCDNGKTCLIEKKHVCCSYPGCGDVFASVLLGKMLSGYSFIESADKAADFITVCINGSKSMDAPRREGLVFEPHLSLLSQN